MQGDARPDIAQQADSERDRRDETGAALYSKMPAGKLPRCVNDRALYERRRKASHNQNENPRR